MCFSGSSFPSQEDVDTFVIEHGGDPGKLLIELKQLYRLVILL